MNNQELLECIDGYLPYNVKGVFLFNGKKEGQIVNKSKTLDLRTVAFYMENSEHIYFKPILRPLSDLIKPCLEEGKVPIVELAKMAFPTMEWKLETNIAESNNGCWFMYNYESFGFAIDGTMTNYVPNQMLLFQQLYKWHFDVFGLIGEGYAIDINKL